MTGNDAHEILAACRLLKTAGLKLTRVEESDESRCDLQAVDGNGCSYLIEVKAINDDKSMQQEVASSRMPIRIQNHVFRGSAVRRLTKAANQLSNTSASENDQSYRVAILIARSSIDEEFVYEQILGSLYGIAALLVGKDEGTMRRCRCLYFKSSVFKRHRDLDGAILTTSRNAAFYLNDFGSRLTELRRTQLGRFFDRSGALYDQLEMEERSDSFVVDFGPDGIPDHEKLARLKAKYPKSGIMHVTEWIRAQGIFG